MPRFQAHMENLLTAIVDDDRAQIKALLWADPLLATRGIGNARSYESGLLICRLDRH